MESSGSVQGLEPKLKLSTYEWDDTKTGAMGFFQFMMDFSVLVRMTLYGDIFEDFLDVKCNRAPALKSQPQWVTGDPDLYVWGSDSHHVHNPRSPAGASTTTGDHGSETQPETQDPVLPRPRASPTRPGAQGSPSTGMSGTSSGSGIQVDAIKNRVGAITPGSGVQPMHEWPPEVHAADRRLFYTLKNVVKGKARETLNQVAPSYVLAMIQLWLVHSVTATERKLKALSGIQKLEWRGNAAKFQADATRRINEFFSSGITVEDIVLLNLRDAFDGKVTHIKYEIAKDIDAGLGSNRALIPDLVQRYVTILASAGMDSKPANYTGQDGNREGGYNDTSRKKKKCTRCGRNGHSTKECHAKRHRDGHELTSTPHKKEEEAEDDAEGSDHNDDEGEDADTPHRKTKKSDESPPKKLNLAELQRLYTAAMDQEKKGSRPRR